MSKYGKDFEKSGQFKVIKLVISLILDVGFLIYNFINVFMFCLLLIFFYSYDNIL